VSREASDSSRGGLQIQTLLLSAVSAVVAATVVPLFWEKGTVIATAMTPVIVALVTEALRRPVEKVSEVAPRVAVRRVESASTTRSRRVERVPADRPATFDPLEGGDPADGAELRPHPGRIPGEDPFGLREPARRRSWWKVGIATGLLAFLLAAAVVTASELTIFGGSVSGQRGDTTLFGGGNAKQDKQKDSSGDSSGSPSESSTPQPGATATPQSTVQPDETATPAPTATPQATATPAPTTAAPQSTATPAP
jgi:hypothetical protein